MNNLKRITTRLTILLFLAFSFTNLVAQDLTTAIGYMEFISGELKKVQKDTWDYTKAVAKNKSAKKIENRRKELVASINVAIGKIKRLKGFQGDNSYKDSCVSDLNIHKIVIEQDYAKIMELEEIAEQTYDNMEAYLLAQQKADEILQASGEHFEAAEKAFAAAHNINLIESQDKISKKLSQASRVYDYYNKIYLIFFKSYKQEVYLLDATMKGDVNAMEQNKNSLLKFATEGIEQMKDIKSFDGDGNLKVACLQMLNFYKEEAEKNYNEIMDFQLKSDNVKKQKASMDAKGSKSHSKEEVEAYNKAINDYNKSINEVNAKNKQLNESRSKLLNNWNSSADNFTSSHVG